MVENAGFKVLLRFTGSLHASLVPLLNAQSQSGRDVADKILKALPEVVVIGNQVASVYPLPVPSVYDL